MVHSVMTQQYTLTVIQLIVRSVMKPAAHSGSNTAYGAQCYDTAIHSDSNTAYSAQCYETSSTQWL